MTTQQKQLWIPPRASEEFRKAPAPKTGNAYGAWAGRDLSYLNLPGGGMLAFDLSKLRLHDYREMRTHYQINASLCILMFMLHQQDFKIVSSDSRVAKKIDDAFRPSWTPLMRGMSQAHWAGFGPNVLEFDNDGPSSSVILKRVKDLVPEECRVNWKEVDGYAAPGDTPPKLYEYDGIAQWSWASLYGIDGTGKASGGGNYLIPPENTLWYPILMENGDYYGRKLLKPSFVPWFFSMLIHLFANRYFERFGEPTPIGRAPFDEVLTTSDGRSITGKDAMLEVMMDLRNRGVVVLPNDRDQIGDSGRSEFAYSLEYLESQMRGADFERYLLRLDEEMSLGLFTPISMQRGGDVGGAHNAIQVHAQVYLWMLNALSGDMKHYIDNYVIDPLVNFNFGPNAARAYWAPKKFGKDNAEILRAVVMESMRVGDVKPDAEELGEAIGLELEDVSELVRPTNALGEDPNNPVANPAAVNQTASTASPRQDNRIVRGTHQNKTIPKTGDSGVIRSKIAARVRNQVIKAKRDDRMEFRPDLGHRRSVEEIYGDDEFVAGIYRRLDAWCADAYPVFDAEEFAAAFAKLLDYELA